MLSSVFTVTKVGFLRIGRAHTPKNPSARPSVPLVGLRGNDGLAEGLRLNEEHQADILSRMIKNLDDQKTETRPGPSLDVIP